MSTPSQQEPRWVSPIEMQEAKHIIAHIGQTRSVVVRHSIDNGVYLLVWGMTFLLDLVVFDLSRLTGSVFPAVIFLVCLNSIVVRWRIWYGHWLPIRLLKICTNRILFWWSFYYVALIGLGVAGWIFLVGPYPPFWFSLIGIAGAFPLLISGSQQWRRARQGSSSFHMIERRGE